MASPLDGILNRLRRTRVRPTETLGAMGTAVYGGQLQSNESSADLRTDKRYETFSEILANTSIVASGVRYFLNLVAGAKWNFEPSEKDADSFYADLAEECLTDDPKTAWHRIVRRAAMYRFYGFSVQEWTAYRRDDGVLSFIDVAPRAQRTIERWDIDDAGDVLGVVQRSPQTMREIYLPRQKLLYAVDDTLSDSPEGLGLFRHLVKPAKRLWRYEQLEGFGFETDLRGVPIGYGPFTRLAEMVESGAITEADRVRIEAPIRDFIENHIRGPKLGMLLDSQPYTAQDDAARPTATKQWEIDLLKAQSTSLEANAEAISRLNKELARILGVEQLLLGEGSAGSFALSKDKTQSLFLTTDNTLTELVNSVADDLLTTLWQLNGWDEEMKPTLATEAIRFQDVEEIAAVLKDMAVSGVVLTNDDPAVVEVFGMLGLSPPLPAPALDPEDEALIGGNAPEGTPDDPEEELPEEN